MQLSQKNWQNMISVSLGVHYLNIYLTIVLYKQRSRDCEFLYQHLHSSDRQLQLIKIPSLIFAPFSKNHFVTLFLTIL